MTKQINWKCLKCGECCKHVVGKNFGLALTKLEADVLLRVAERHGIKLQLYPLTTNGMWVTTYQMSQAPCPFLRGGECIVYNHRPLACKMFPLHPKGISQCSFLDRYAKGIPVAFPQEMKAAAIEYDRQIGEVLRGCRKRYNLSRGWERPYVDNRNYMKVDY